MRASLQVLTGLLRTPAGRRKIVSAWNYASFPLLWPLAALYRRLLARRMRIVTIVGSVGKTTTRSAVATALGVPHRHGDARNAWSEVVWTLFEVPLSAPRAVLEVGIAKPGQMRWYARMLRPQIAVVTAIASDHNRSLPSLEVTRTEKADMVRALAADGLAVLNGDDANVLWMRTQTRARVVTVGFGADNDVRAEDWAVEWPRGSRFTVRIGARSWAVRTRFIGRHHVFPFLAALAVADAEGVDMEAAVAALSALEPVAGRMDVIPLASGAWILADDFKAPQESYQAAFDTLESLAGHRRLVVLGAVNEPAGGQSRLYRELGTRAGRVASRALLLGGGKVRDAMAKAAVHAGMRAEDVTVSAEMNVLEAAAWLEKQLVAGDVLLVKGRTEQRLRRIVLKLRGRAVRCDIPVCNVNDLTCDQCPMLERGWQGLRPVT
ncbi:MAG: hypothetical protein JNG86_08570 [Verrucomicrobiaceae bacterium]|nr:hypothetical protein [Verrucomicrobiaceae bacterium]